MLQSLAAALTGNPLFSACMVAAVLVAIRLRDAPVAATTAILVTNWVLGSLFMAAVFDPAHPWAQRPWTWFVAIDYLAGFCIVCLAKPSRAQALIGLIYALMLIRHVAYWKSGMGEWSTYQYDWQLTYAATAQFLVVTGWGLCELVTRRDHHRIGATGSASIDPALNAVADRSGSQAVDANEVTGGLINGR